MTSICLSRDFCDLLELNRRIRDISEAASQSKVCIQIDIDTAFI